MFKKIAVPIILGAFALFILPVFYLIDYSQQITVSQEKIQYTLPYPGILPDHPLYTVKTGRDKILEFFTRDSIQKAELYLLFSDKRVRMAQDLAKKGKSKLAISTFSKAEKYFLKIPQLLKNSKEQGVAPSPDFISTLKLSNQKHKEVLDALIEDLPQGEQEGLSEIVKLNKEVSDALSQLR